MTRDDGNDGGGSGGGPGEGVQSVTAEETYLITGNQVAIWANAPALAAPPTSVITLLASGANDMGVVDVRGTHQVRVTTGATPVPATHSFVNPLPGVEVEVPATASISLQQGPAPAGAVIEMRPALGITINAGVLPVTVQSDTEVVFRITGAGISEIRLTPDGVYISGPFVRILGEAEASIKTLATRVEQVGAEVKIGAPVTRIDPV